MVHVAVFGGITYGLIQQGEEGPIAWLGASAVAGAVIAFPVVIWARRLADREKDGRLERFLDAASTRDFTVLIVALAVIDRLEWFLWLTAITVHFFWIAVLIHLIAKLIKARRADRPVS